MRRQKTINLSNFARPRGVADSTLPIAENTVRCHK